MGASRPNPNCEFGTLLTQGLKSIAAREDKEMSVLEKDLAAEMDRTSSTIEKWRQGRLPPNPQQVELLARACIQRGGMDKQWLVRFLQQAGYHGAEMLLRELFPAEEPKELNGHFVHHNLPGRPYEKFVGREKELTELEGYLLRRCRHGVISLSGVAGVGKTTLALEIAHRYVACYTSLLPEERFEAIVWVTAKQTELLPSDLFVRSPTFTDLSSLYRAIAEVLDLPAVTRAFSDEDRHVIVAHALAEHRVLLVLDNMEDIDDPVLMVFLRDLPAPSKAIVTTRHRIGIGVSIDLRTFKETEAHELIRLECQRHHLSLSEEQAERLLKHTGGLALAIVRTIGRMAWRGSKIEVELRQLGNPANTFYDFCFEKSITLLRGRGAHRLFMALALFSFDATRDALGYVAGFEEDVLDRDDGLSELVVLSLVNKEGNRFSLEALTKVKARTELVAHPEFEREARKHWVELYRKLAVQIENATTYSDLHKAEISNLKNVIDWLVEQGRMADAAWFFQRIRRFLYAVGRWSLLLRMAGHVATWAESIDDTELLADALDSLTNVYRRQADITQGTRWLGRIQNVAIRLNDEPLQAEVRLNQVEIMYHRPNSSQEEIDMVTQALEVFRRHNKTNRVVKALKALGNSHLKLRDLDKARYFYQEGLRVLEETGDKTPIAIHLRAALRGNLGHVAAHRGRYKEACEYLYEILKDLTEQTDLAEAYVTLALCEFRLGHLKEAHLLRQKADRIVKQLNLTLPLCPEDSEWKRLQPG